VDDSKATNVHATYTGLIGLKGQKSVILLGGLAKVYDILVMKCTFIYMIACLALAFHLIYQKLLFPSFCSIRKL
jgi:UDP-N-acetylmuramoylalanine-D-glutamate ligase